MNRVGMDDYREYRQAMRRLTSSTARAYWRLAWMTWGKAFALVVPRAVFELEELPRILGYTWREDSSANVWRLVPA